MPKTPSAPRLSQVNQVMDVIDRTRHGVAGVADSESLRALVRTTYQEQGIEVDDALIASAVAQLLGSSGALHAPVVPSSPASIAPSRTVSLKDWWLGRQRAHRAETIASNALPVVCTPQDEADVALAGLRAHKLRTDADILARLDELWGETELARRWYGWKAVFWSILGASGPVAFVLAPILLDLSASGLFPFLGGILTTFFLPFCALDAFHQKGKQVRTLEEIKDARIALSRLDYKDYNLVRLLGIKTGRMEPLPTDSVLWNIAKRGAAAHEEVGEIWAQWLDSDKVIRDCDVWLLSEVCDKLVAGNAWALRKQLNEQGAAAQASVRSQLKVLPAPRRVAIDMEQETLKLKLEKEQAEHLNKMQAMEEAERGVEKKAAAWDDLYGDHGKAEAEELKEKEFQKMNQKMERSVLKTAYLMETRRQNNALLRDAHEDLS